MSLVLAKRKIPLMWLAGNRRSTYLLGPATIKRGMPGRVLALQRSRKSVPSLPFGLFRSTLKGSTTKVDYHCSGLSWAITKNSAPAAAQDLMTVLDHMKLKKHHVDLHFCGDVLIRGLNQYHRDEDKATDVISLAVPEEMKNHQLNLGLLGEMFISVETAKAQAIARGHPLSDELRILMVHSVFHLLGYDHVKDEEADIMESKENQILAELNWIPKGSHGGLLTSGDVLGDNPIRSSTASDVVVPRKEKEEREQKKNQAKQKAEVKKNKKVVPKTVLGNKSKKGKVYKPVSWKK